MEFQTRRPIAGLSLDLDDKWAYLRVRGESGWESYPSFLQIAVPRFEELFSAFRTKATIFIVGKDAALERNRDLLLSLALSGHEIGNHSYGHRSWMQVDTPAEIEREIGAAEEAILEATGFRPVGFRGPGYSLSETILDVLKKRDYLYDSSTFPTFIGPLARTYYFASSSLSRAGRERRDNLFGRFADVLRPIKPYTWKLSSGALLELPLTTLPIARIPFHLSYVLWLSRFSSSLARGFFRSALLSCRAAGISPILLLHPLDLLGAGDVPELKFFPGMDLQAGEKREKVYQYMQDVFSLFSPTTVAGYAQWVSADGKLPERRPDFASVPKRGRPARPLRSEVPSAPVNIDSEVRGE